MWLNDGSCVRLRPEHTNHVWSYDFVSAKTHDGRTVRMLNLIDEHSRESLLVRPERRWSSAKVIEALADVMVMKGVPEHIRSDNGPEFVAKDLRKWLADTGANTLYIEPGSPWENGYCESFNSKLRDEFLNGEIFYSLKEVQVLAERWRVHYNTIRPHSSLGYRSPPPIRQLSRYFKSCVTLTIQLVQKIGHASLPKFFGSRLWIQLFEMSEEHPTSSASLRHLIAASRSRLLQSTHPGSCAIY